MTTPLFAHLAAQAKPLSSALPAQPTPVVTSPWTPQVDDGSAQRALAETKRQAMEAGRAEGLRETEALRGRLAQLIGELERARAAAAVTNAEAIADAAVTVVEAFVGASESATLFAPLVKGWIARNGGPAVVRVNPTEVAAMRAAIGTVRASIATAQTSTAATDSPNDANPAADNGPAIPITVEGDANIAPGNVALRGAALDLHHDWRERLRELRDVIAAAVEAQA